MKPFPAGLDTLLATGQFVHCDLYTITTVGSGTYYYTTGQMDVLSGGNLYQSNWLFIDEESNKSLAHWKTGFDVDTWVVRMKPAAADPVTGAAYPAKIGTIPWLAAFVGGVFEGATVQIDRAYWPAWPAAGTYPFVPSYVLSKLFYGRVASCDLMRNQAVVTIESFMALLDNPMPRNLWQQHCRHTLFDSGCTLSQAAYAVGGTVSLIVDNHYFNANLSGEPSGSKTFALGQILWLTGQNAGLRQHVTTYGGTGLVGSFILIKAMPFPIALGDTFTAYPGCDKTFASCTSFGNTANYGGQPFIPSPETAI